MGRDRLQQRDAGRVLRGGAAALDDAGGSIEILKNRIAESIFERSFISKK